MAMLNSQRVGLSLENPSKSMGILPVSTAAAPPSPRGRRTGPRLATLLLRALRLPRRLRAAGLHLENHRSPDSSLRIWGNCLVGGKSQLYNIWFIYGLHSLYMVYIWFIYGLYMVCIVYIWLVYR